MTPTIGSVTTPTSATSSSSSSSSSSTTGLGNNLNTFLKLLTTQLQNQDPLSPLDTNQFTQQLVQFSQVEQAINTNTKLDSLIALQSTDQTVSALPIVGRTVEYSDSSVVLANGKASINYTLPSTAARSVITITDAQNRTVYAGFGETAAGAHSFTWDGTLPDGSTAPDGTYKVTVSAVDASGKAITPTVTSLGTVNAIEMQGGQAVLDFGGLTEPFSKIVSVQNTGS
jgi:flagellar basal-body rod modification protein FlgD